jgi:hypothetical protein
VSDTAQFRVVLPDAATSQGTELLVNGQTIRNVVAVKVENGAELDDLLRSRITIDLIGEPIPVIERAEGAGDA